ncbi:hypothetical protein Agub_g2351 [Astrephomene gubernaculifera]|uniref:Uncharacterized protein n=1 Tax=Astrephomene gubernaculifera TaxID=47775 RepID=A0AAD3DGX8_9CHLO|nr:hypothetical protein Agub_g2351 [Astrephomene gubernaculifera]
MGLAYPACHSASSFPLQRLSRCSRLASRGLDAAVRTSCATAGASFPAGRILLASERPHHPVVRPVASASNGTGISESNPQQASPQQSTNGLGAAATIAAALQSVDDRSASVVTPPRPAQQAQQQPIINPVPEDVIAEFEHKLEADLQTVGVTLTAILGVIIFWRGVWSLLDHFLGDSVVGDICCIIVGLTIVLYIRLSGMKIASFWPPS